MQIQVHTDKNIEGGERFSEYVKSYVEDSLSRFGSRITSVDVHVADENAEKNNGGNDKRCKIEVRLPGANPLVVTQHAASVEDALHAAAEKIKRMLNDSDNT
jgi:ribosomal subunit interface protein